MVDDVERLAEAIKRRAAAAHGLSSSLSKPPSSLPPPTSTDGPTSTLSSSSSSSSSRHTVDRGPSAGKSTASIPLVSQSSDSPSSSAQPPHGSPESTGGTSISDQIMSLINSALDVRLQQSASSSSATLSHLPVPAAHISAPDAEVAAALQTLRASKQSHLLREPSAATAPAPNPTPLDARVSPPSISHAMDDSDSNSGDSAPARQSKPVRSKDPATKRRAKLRALMREARADEVFTPTGQASSDEQRMFGGHFVDLDALKALLFVTNSSRPHEAKIRSFADIARVHLTAAQHRAAQLLVTHGPAAPAAYLFETVKLVSRIMSFESRLTTEQAVVLRNTIMLEAAQEGKPFGRADLATESLMAASFEPSASSSTSVAPSSSGAPSSDFCGRFNSFGGCADDRCPREHRCRSCTSTRHGKVECPRNPQLRARRARLAPRPQPALGMPFFYQTPSPPPQPQQPPVPQPQMQPQPQVQPTPFPGYSHVPQLPGAITAYAAPLPLPSTAAGANSSAPPTPKRAKRFR